LGPGTFTRTEKTGGAFIAKEFELSPVKDGLAREKRGPHWGGQTQKDFSTAGLIGGQLQITLPLGARKKGRKQKGRVFTGEGIPLGISPGSIYKGVPTQ